jgi:hypothetical protein
MVAPSDTSSPPGSSSQAEKRSSGKSPAVLSRDPWRWIPLSWQVGGTLFTVSGYAVGTLNIVEVAAHIAILSFVTAVYLSFVIRDRRRPQDLVAILGYLMYAAGMGFVSAPSLFALDTRLTTPTRALGGLCLGLVLALTWLLYVEYLAE